MHVHTRARRDLFLCKNSRKPRERELLIAKNGGKKNRRALGMLNPLRDKSEGTYIPDGERDDACGHRLSRTWKANMG